MSGFLMHVLTLSTVKYMMQFHRFTSRGAAQSALFYTIKSGLERIDFKTALLVFKSLHGLAPKYISDMLVRYEPSRTLRTSGTGILLVPRVRTKRGPESGLNMDQIRLNVDQSQTKRGPESGLNVDQSQD
ncbi:hypothetical protein WMY93_018390 [Mugilogobius chulae]|uniref:Uncharacterized protein n=1 Tax=Mugilogobius chulae TaxID=88201 RepID=A0AAW0NVH5_9GOBI